MPRYSGPYFIEKKYSDTVYQLKDARTGEILKSLDFIGDLKPYISGDKPTPDEIEADEFLQKRFQLIQEQELKLNKRHAQIPLNV